MLTDLCYIVAAALFIVGIKRMSAPKTARAGNLLAAVAMLLAIVITLFDRQILGYGWIVAGIIIGSLLGAISARKVAMTAMPQMVAVFNGFGGIASAFVAYSEYLRATSLDSLNLTIMILCGIIGGITFSGSILAFMKLQGLAFQRPFVYRGQQLVNIAFAALLLAASVGLVLMPSQQILFASILFVALLLGLLVVVPIGGADMPVVISLLNSFSGVAAGIAGFILMNKVLIVSGAIVGAAGLILTEIMCKAMNRSLINVMFGAFGTVEKGIEKKESGGYENVKSTTSEEVAMLLDGARLVVIVPGYGLAVARAQHAIRELDKCLQARGTEVKYAIHPVAGRMPGHMNVLLSEAEVPYDQLFEMDEINPEFERADMALVVGANDVTNPAARNEKGSPIYGMPILNVDKASSVVVVKRSLSPGYAGIKNPLYENENTMLLFDDAKIAIEKLTKELKGLD